MHGARGGISTGVRVQVAIGVKVSVIQWGYGPHVYMVWHVVRRAVAAVAGRCRGSARRESGVRRATASGRAAP